MKVVLFCGGFGMRMREYSEAIPKPIVPIGYRPTLWHVMKYYAHFGHKDFILCLGYRGDTIKKYFLEYDECMSNDFVLSQGGKNLALLSSDIHDWNITFVDTGLNSNIGQRREIFDYMHDGEELVEEPFGRLINERKLMAYPYEGYWACMDTFKEKQELDDLFGRASAPGRFGIINVDQGRRM